MCQSREARRYEERPKHILAHRALMLVFAVGAHGGPVGLLMRLWARPAEEAADVRYVARVPSQEGSHAVRLILLL